MPTATPDTDVSAMLSQIDGHLASRIERPEPPAHKPAAPHAPAAATRGAAAAADAGGAPQAPVAAAPTPAASIGWQRPGRFERAAVVLVALAVIGLIVGAVLAAGGAYRQLDRLAALGQTGAGAERLAHAGSQALAGQAPAFAELRDASAQLQAAQAPLAPGVADSASVTGALAALPPLVATTRRSAEVIGGHQAVLERASRVAQNLSARMPAWTDALQALASEPGVAAQPVHQQAVHELHLLAQRIARQARSLHTPTGLQPEAALPIGADLQTFQERLQALQAALPAGARERLGEVAAPFAAVSADARVLIGQIEQLRKVQAAHTALERQAPALRRAAEQAAQQVQHGGPIGLWPAVLLLASLLTLLAVAAALLRTSMRSQARRTQAVERELGIVGHQEREAKRINDANQAAIVRLMNELQAVAAGDLTQQATVTEDITGAIADTINYTVDELRMLLAQVQSVAARVLATTQQVEATSTDLLAASGEQLREIRETGQSVLQTAGRINEASGQAQHMAEVAQQSLAAADTGHAAVGSTIAGMNRLRDQIQDTAKRIKRLGESSQEIGEITEMISGITEQTNVLALNAAIQAASAGEAGRGFSSVAEEVQRLAERSADATRAIAGLVKAIQADTQGAVAAMEQSTQGVVQSARLADAAGGALTDIGRVTRELSALIAQIEAGMRREAQSANVVATHIEHIFAVTEQTSDGTRTTVQTAHELSRMAQELRASVDRFKIS